MRILQVCPQYYPSIGGVEQHVRNTSERLAHDHEVTVFTCDPSGQLPKEETLNGVIVKRFRSFSPQGAYHISFGMLSELRHSSFDVIHGHSYHAIPLFFSSYAKADKFIINAYYHGHGHTLFRDFLFRLYKPLGGRIFQRANRVVALSNFEKSLLIKDFNIDGSSIAVIPYGMNLAEFEGLRREKSERKTILCVGRLEEYKGIQCIIKAMQFVESGVHLEIVGKGLYKKNLVNITEKLGLKERVAFFQDLQREELLNKYASADLFVMLSKYESFSIVVAEALASKVPCIVANTSALKEWIDNKNCFGIDYPISIERLAQLINSVIGREVGDVQLWDWDDVVRETLEVYNRGK
jgi:glycosyltransferase involved in cell wall biosynthesis